MTHTANNLLDPSVCSCFPQSNQPTIFNKVKWSTLSIGTALLIIIVYLSSGLYTLIDVTTMISRQSFHSGDVLWPIASSSLITILSWTSLSIYFTVVLLVTILLCGIQLEKPCLLFLWSIMMVFMLLADGVITILSLREHQQQNYQSTKQIKVLFFVMSVRLLVLLCGIFVTIFHFRCLSKARSEQLNRQRMLDRYNADPPSPSYHDSWARSAAFLDPSKDGNDDRYEEDRPPPAPLPRAKFATAQHYPMSNTHYSQNQPSEYVTEAHHRAMNRFNDDFRYNIPLQDRFRQEQIHNIQQF